MSRTDKTRPWWVKIADRPMVTCRPRHDHRFGPCTLPARINVDSTATGGRPTSGCHWTVSEQHADLLHDGCRSCTGHHLRREQRRRSRHQIRRELRAQHGDN